MMAGVLWFGAVLYVHILLKPAYASKGLPKGELYLGWSAIIVVAVTGVLLTMSRMPSFESFNATPFGILLTIKIFLFLIMFGSALITTVFIGPKLRRKLKSPVAAICSNEITLEQLGEFDGKEGRPAYIGYKGIVYDVSNNQFWKHGSHMTKHQAGRDLTAALASATHGEDKIFAMKQVGIIRLSESKPTLPFHERLFYYFAYMNLLLVFAIIFIISLWRWW
jgi:predicted heme/steroid binding protein